MTDLLQALRHIESCDPDGGEREPTEDDYARHEAWARQTYGDDVWRRYHEGGWEPTPDF